MEKNYQVEMQMTDGRQRPVEPNTRLFEWNVSVFKHLKYHVNYVKAWSDNIQVSHDIHGGYVPNYF